MFLNACSSTAPGTPEPSYSASGIGHQCELCLYMCKYADSLHVHYKYTHADVYCLSCQLVFSGSHALRNHRIRSSVHNGETVQCLAGCGRVFSERSSMWKHIERAGCANAISTLTDVIADLVTGDRENLIVKPGVRAGDVRTVRWEVSESMHDSATGEWRCFMCNKTTSKSCYLQAHLDGGKHDKKVFKCPGQQCSHDASTLSNLMLHIEGRNCDGYKEAMKRL
ncbi:hypothetical protein AURDEDRAFT_115915 [Auricularia subglabra TFB-10046 SS5]|nr:hypothetical protein AURDEDRAFT_115915 [Auricularia subglabra TFB-10046 SS5]